MRCRSVGNRHSLQAPAQRTRDDRLWKITSLLADLDRAAVAFSKDQEIRLNIYFVAADGRGDNGPGLVAQPLGREGEFADGDSAPQLGSDCSEFTTFVVRAFGTRAGKVLRFGCPCRVTTSFDLQRALLCQRHGVLQRVNRPQLNGELPPVAERELVFDITAVIGAFEPALRGMLPGV